MSETIQRFINAASNKFNNKYDYSEVYFNRVRDKIKIICPIHGMFETTPVSHINSKTGCLKCSGKFRYTNASFIKKAREIHGDKYDYSLVDYKGNKTKVKIICPEHGIFEQTPNGHMTGYGCTKCGSKLISDKLVSNKNEFIKKAREIHGDKYDYSLVEYKNNKTNVKIICPIHGVFEQTPNGHMMGHGCAKCGNQYSTYHEYVKNYSIINNIKYIESTTDIISPLELDFYFQIII